MSNAAHADAVRATTDVAHDPRAYRRILFSGFLGSTVEFYDFLLYGTAASLVFGPLFFSGMSPAASLTASFATFAVGYVARPLGGIIFGHIGDRVGRKATLVATMLIMGIASTLIGLLPTSEQIGSLAPVLLVLLRLLQGVAVGGEWGGAALMALEHAPQGKRGLGASVANMGGPAGALLATLAFAAMTLLPREDLLSWGWRIPFLLSGVLVAVAMYIRLQITESPLFVEAQERAEKEQEKRKSPIAVVLTKYRGQVVVATLGAIAALTYSSFMATFSIAIAEDSGVSASQVLLAKAFAAFFHIFAIAYFARLSDRIGRRPVLLMGVALSVIFVGPLMALLSSGNIWLIIGGFLLGSPIIQACLYGPTAAFISERFSTEARYTGAGVSYQLGTVFSGFAPLICTSLWIAGQESFGGGLGDFTFVIAFVITVSVVTGAVAFMSKETREHQLV